MTKSRSETLVKVRSFLGELRVADPVVLTLDGRDLRVRVQRVVHGDPGGYGHPDHHAVTVGWGAGRFNTEVSAARIVDGYCDLRRDAS